LKPPSLKEDILNSLIQSYSTEEPPFGEGEPIIRLNKMSTFLDVANFEDEFIIFEGNYILKRQNAPNFETALELWISEIESVVGSVDNYLYEFVNDEIKSKYSKMCSYAFWETTKGNTIFLRRIAESLLVQDETQSEFQYKLEENLFQAIATGTVYAYSLPRLKKELSDLKNKKIEDFSDEPNNKSDESIKPLSVNTIKLKWKGAKNQLYNVLRQLKNDHDMIGNSYNELADFLISNVQKFNNNKKETVEKELKRGQPLPKSKRIKIEPGEAE